MLCSSGDISNPSYHIFLHLHKHRCNNNREKLQEMVVNINYFDIEHKKFQYLPGKHSKKLPEMLDLSLVYKGEDK